MCARLRTCVCFPRPLLAPTYMSPPSPSPSDCCQQAHAAHSGKSRTRARARTQESGVDGPPGVILPARACVAVTSLTCLNFFYLPSPRCAAPQGRVVAPRHILGVRVFPRAVPCFILCFPGRAAIDEAGKQATANRRSRKKKTNKNTQTLRGLPTTSRKPTWLFMGSVLIWHM